MQREAAENHVFKRFWLEPVVKYKLQSSMFLLGAHSLGKVDPYQTQWCLSVTGQPRHMEERFLSLLLKEKARQGKKYTFLITF